jgi:hypothetical protein
MEGDWGRGLLRRAEGEGRGQGEERARKMVDEKGFYSLRWLFSCSYTSAAQVHSVFDLSTDSPAWAPSML